jgi:threonyl-tRNA synthetase
VQARILPVSNKFDSYAMEVLEALEEAGARVELDNSADSLGKRIRNAEMLKTPFMIVIGEQEVENKTITVRDYSTKEQTEMSVEDLIGKLAFPES